MKTIAHRDDELAKVTVTDFDRRRFITLGSMALGGALLPRVLRASDLPTKSEAAGRPQPAREMVLAAHYYRPPFPERRFWKRDLSAMREAGLDALQLWITWGSVETKPGEYSFDDYDALCAEANANGLGVILSVLGELQPEWIHRLVPDSNLITHLGQPVSSTHRIESNQGLTPGGCTDHPEIKRLMGNFLAATAEHFRDNSSVIAWDVWNELRWNIHTDGYACHCPHTIATFRNWLKQSHGDLAGLNRAWNRNYSDWADVFPGKLPGRPYTEMMAFQAFLQERAHEHLRFRTAIFRAAGVRQIIMAHGAASSIDQVGNTSVFQQAVCRGNDWVHAENVDAYGVSHFPLWSRKNDTDFLIKVDASASATGTKTLWVSELQGGASNYGHSVDRPVTALQMQRWLWMSVAAGAKGVIFWSWSSEVFGREATGFGIAGRDGYAPERLEALRMTSTCWRKNRTILQNYRPDNPIVGVFFSVENYNLEASETGTAEKAAASIYGYLRASMRIHQQPAVVESSHLQILPSLRLLILPCAFVIPGNALEPIAQFVENGGTLILEGDTDAWSQNGFYRAEPTDRPLLSRLGIGFMGRRNLEPGSTIELGNNLSIACEWFTTPLNETDGVRVLSRNARGEAIAVERDAGKGHVIALGSFCGLAYSANPSVGLETLLARVLATSDTSKDTLEVITKDELIVRTGLSGESRLLFIFNLSDKHREAEIVLHGVEASNARDLLHDNLISLQPHPRGRRLGVSLAPTGSAIIQV